MNKAYIQGFNDAINANGYVNPFDGETQDVEYWQYDKGFNSGLDDIENEERREAHLAQWYKLQA